MQSWFIYTLDAVLKQKLVCDLNTDANFAPVLWFGLQVSSTVFVVVKFNIDMIGKWRRKSG